MPDAVEQQVIEGLRARTPEAGRQLVRLYYQSVYRFLAVLTGDSHRAEDLTQDTFAAAWGHLGSFTNESGLRTWLHRIAYRKFVDEFRRRKRQGAALERIAARERPAGQSEPLDLLLADERLRELTAALARLSASDRVVLAARYIQDLSSVQLGELLDKPPATVRTRIHKALGRLRAMMNGQLES
ncbi:MAG: RNA polymerase sigma factor [Planctomycetota bacterium]|nr:RNA polymerase sigma factor [Planctomycetota bacterium]